VSKLYYAIDWSHTKGLTIYDGKKLLILDRRALLKRLAGESKLALKSRLVVNPASNGTEGESRAGVKSMRVLNSSVPVVVLEQGCPLSLIYDILKTGCQVNVISNRATQDYRVEHNIEKTDENDARIIYELANNGTKLTPVSLADDQIQLIDLYQRYKRYQKARVSLSNMKKAYIRQVGDGIKSRIEVKSTTTLNNPSPAIEGEGESSVRVKSMVYFNPPPSTDGTLPYDIGIDTLKAAENSCLKKIVKLVPPVPQSIKIRGLGPRIWAGIYITANPVNFPTMSSYLRYCGLVDKEQIGTKWNRHACMLYHMLAEAIMKQRDKKFRPIYDQCKVDITEKYPNYTKLHIHNAAMNRTSTFLAKEIWKGGKRWLENEPVAPVVMKRVAPGVPVLAVDSTMGKTGL